eukprot:4526713-Karenia_brevis.AAC.1
MVAMLSMSALQQQAPIILLRLLWPICVTAASQWMLFQSEWSVDIRYTATAPTRQSHDCIWIKSEWGLTPQGKQCSMEEVV